MLPISISNRSVSEIHSPSWCLNLYPSGVGNRNPECYLIPVNFHLNKQSLLCYCCYRTFIESQTGSWCPGKYRIERSLWERQEAQSNGWHGTWEQETRGVAPKSPSELTWWCVHIPEPILHCPFHPPTPNPHPLMGILKDNSMCKSWGTEHNVLCD